jgi:hypothetical protein
MRPPLPLSHAPVTSQHPPRTHAGARGEVPLPLRRFPHQRVRASQPLCLVGLLLSGLS